MVTAAVVGARGYLGRELVRLLLSHPNVDGITLTTGSAPGTPYGELVPAFRHRTELVLKPSAAARDADVVFLATDATEALAQTAELEDAGSALVDLSRAHRHEALLGDRWHYGMADLNPTPRGAKRIANPGCYPTATLLASVPALRSGLAGPGVLIADGKSGVSGAGATPRSDLHYAEMNESMRAYKVIGHDHQEEIQLATGAVAGASRPVRFTPHLVPMTRGLLSTVYLPIAAPEEAELVRQAYQDEYAGKPFVRLVPEPDTGAVAHGNFADVAADVDPATGILVARCAIDNLVKGGAGQAVHNMNQAFGFPETAGFALAARKEVVA